MFAPQMTPRSPRFGALVATLTLTLAASCASTGGDSVLYGSSEALARLQPGDIAVAPLRNPSGNAALPWDDLRESLQTVLVDGLYSPLASDYVEGNWVESAFRGTPAPDALLVVSMHRWDTSELFITGKIEVEAELFLFEGGSTTGTLLWGTMVTEEFDMRGGRTDHPSPSPELMPEAAMMFARRALADLPARDPLLAHP